MTRTRLTLAAALVAVAAGPSPLAAQHLGVFNWQLEPFCNNLTLGVTQQGAIYTIDGFDDQCGAPQRAPLAGTATVNPDGTIGFGLHVVTVPGGRGVDLDARIALPSLGGTWRDSLGNVGTFAFNARTGGLPRPLPTIPGSAIAPASIGPAQLAPAAVGTAAIADGSVTPQKLSVALPRLASSGLTTGVIQVPLGGNLVVRSVTLQVPSAGQVMVNASGLFGFTVGSGFYVTGWCSITTGAAVETAHYMYASIVSPNTVQNLPFAGTRVYAATPGPFTVHLVCTAASNLAVAPGFSILTLQTAGLTALFVPD
jgi:hypothetical protein